MRSVAALILLALIPLACYGKHTRPSSIRRRHRNFDEYLQSLNSEEQELIDRLERGCEVEGSGDSEIGLPSNDRECGKVPNYMNKKERVCCALGVMAGDKGYHCYVDFYVARIMMRNQNRAHNRKMIFGGGEIKKSKEKLMKMFMQCVARKHNVFHKCCHLAALKIPSYDRYDTQQAKKYDKRMNKRKHRTM